jgi:hypothetical protein
VAKRGLNNFCIALAGLFRAVVLDIIIQPTLEKIANRHSRWLDVPSLTKIAQSSRQRSLRLLPCGKATEPSLSPSTIT